ncbi:MAG: nitrate ABC transporter substrate-binding protein, partial [Pseudomonadota bacterium]
HGVSLDPGRIAILGQGISRPKNGVCSALPCMPATEQEWRDNMRVKVRILQVEAEQDLFHPRMNSL